MRALDRVGGFPDLGQEEPQAEGQELTGFEQGAEGSRVEGSAPGQGDNDVFIECDGWAHALLARLHEASKPSKRPIPDSDRQDRGHRPTASGQPLWWTGRMGAQFPLRPYRTVQRRLETPQGLHESVGVVAVVVGVEGDPEPARSTAADDPGLGSETFRRHPRIVIGVP